MSQGFVDLQNRIAEAIKNRTIELPAKKVKDYESGAYKPMFSLINRGGELLCTWCSNRRRPDVNGKGGDVEIVRFRDIGQGLDTDSNSPRSWEVVTLKVMHSLGLEL